MSESSDLRALGELLIRLENEFGKPDAYLRIINGGTAFVSWFETKIAIIILRTPYGVDWITQIYYSCPNEIDNFFKKLKLDLDIELKLFRQIETEPGDTFTEIGEVFDYQRPSFIDLAKGLGTLTKINETLMILFEDSKERIDKKLDKILEILEEE